MTQRDMFARGSAVEVPDDRAREYEMDLTPAPVVAQLLEYLATHHGFVDDDAPERILDPSAGAGVFGQECKRMWPKAHRVGVEPRREESENLCKNYDEIMVGPFSGLGGRLFDLIATNPPFSKACDLVGKLVRHLSDFGELWLLQLDDFGQRSEAGRELFDFLPPTHQLRIAGTLSFRGPGTGCDSRSYSWWGWCKQELFDRDGDRTMRSSWSCRNLEILPPEDRQWTTRPGEDWRYAS